MLIVDFANRSFRDFADQDDITARIAYRLELDHQSAGALYKQTCCHSASN